MKSPPAWQAGPARSEFLVVCRQHQEFTVPTRCSLCRRHGQPTLHGVNSWLCVASSALCALPPPLPSAILGFPLTLPVCCVLPSASALCTWQCAFPHCCPNMLRNVQLNSAQLLTRHGAALGQVPPFSASCRCGRMDLLASGYKTTRPRRTGGAPAGQIKTTQQAKTVPHGKRRNRSVSHRSSHSTLCSTELGQMITAPRQQTRRAAGARCPARRRCCRSCAAAAPAARAAPRCLGRHSCLACGFAAGFKGCKSGGEVRVTRVACMGWGAGPQRQVQGLRVCCPCFQQPKRAPHHCCSWTGPCTPPSQAVLEAAAKPPHP